jgi:pimeloyl-ACP methyl ester carboxylesterase
MTTTATPPSPTKPYPVHYKTVAIDEQEVFYREAGSADAPVMLLLHGFPTSSNMFRNLIAKLSPNFHVIAPDYIGYGLSSMPDPKKFAYTFENQTNFVEKLVKHLGLTKFFMYVMDSCA